MRGAWRLSHVAHENVPRPVGWCPWSLVAFSQSHQTLPHACSKELVASARLHRLGDYQLAWASGRVGGPATEVSSQAAPPAIGPTLRACSPAAFDCQGAC